MLLKMLPFGKNALMNTQISCGFAASTAERVNYYRLLDLDSGATAQQITDAYTDKTRNLDPKSNKKAFDLMNEAFVILTNSKARDAYDSLLKVKASSHYLNQPEAITVKSKSYLTERKQKANTDVRKKMNLDEFGRYKGGLPKRNFGDDTRNRSTAVQPPGTFATRYDIECYAELNPEYNVVDSEVAESFKDFHQNYNRDKTMKRPWYNFEVDYEFFTLKTFREKYLGWIRLFLVVGIAFPTIMRFFQARARLSSENKIRAKSGLPAL